jgi:phenylalanyl-tRNA synthetase beta subunit
MDDSEVVTFGSQPADKEAVEDTLQESELESARMENIIQSKMTEQLTGATRRIYFHFFSRTFDARSVTIVHVISVINIHCYSWGTF